MPVATGTTEGKNSEAPIGSGIHYYLAGVSAAKTGAISPDRGLSSS